MAVARWILWGTLAVSAGCAGLPRPAIQADLKQAVNPVARADSRAAYAIACPDVVRVIAPGRPAAEGLRPVEPDGRVDLGRYGRPRLEGATPTEAARRVGEMVGLPAERVGVEVAEYRSRHVQLFGLVSGAPRSVAWEGPEKVVELLRRTGGLQPGAAVNEVHVVRSRVAEGRRPEVYRIDLRAIVTRQDDRTDLQLQPDDEIYVGELKRSSLCKLLPPWLRPTFCRLCGLTGKPDCGCGATSAGRQHPVPSASESPVPGIE